MENRNSTNELYHYGVKGMKWGVRKLRPYAARVGRGHAGPGVYVGSGKRQLERAKKDLKKLDDGQHLSVGFTKKRQAAYDKRDRAALEKKISKLEAEEAARKNKTAAKQEQKQLDKKMRSELRDVALRNPTAYHMKRHAKRAVASGVGALATAAVGSAATVALAKRGKTEAAARVYKNSRKTFDAFVTAANLETGMATINYMMGGGATYNRYREAERKVRDKYKK